MLAESALDGVRRSLNNMVEAAIAAGAETIVRGGPAMDGDLARGAFYRPTLLEVADSGLPIVQEEIFGPVLTMQVFDTEAEAVSLANDSEYGLSASVWSRDVDRPLRVARASQRPPPQWPDTIFRRGAVPGMKIRMI